MLNTCASDEFNAAVQAAGAQIRETALSAGTLTGASGSVKSELSDSLSGASASFDVDRFTDYIYDQNDYALSDGSHVKVSTAYDYVYEDGSGNVYATDSALDEPAGMTRVYGE